VDLKALHFELSGLSGFPDFGISTVYPGGGPSWIVKGLPLPGIAFRITGFPAFWISGDHGALVSGRTGRRPRETSEASALSIDSRRYLISVFQVFRIPRFPAFLLSRFCRFRG
jgi:hypothetical protein